MCVCVCHHYDGSLAGHGHGCHGGVCLPSIVPRRNRSRCACCWQLAYMDFDWRIATFSSLVVGVQKGGRGEGGVWASLRGRGTRDEKEGWRPRIG